ncbi:hypothetical protein Tco_0485082 [Tanacetum coccineum]
MPPKRTSTSETPAITLDAIRQLVADSVAIALKAQAANLANTDNTNKNTGTSGTSVARKEINDHKRKIEDKGNTTTNNNYPKHNNNNHSNNHINKNNYPNNRNNNNRNNYHHQQQNGRQEIFKANGNRGYNGPHPLLLPPKKRIHSPSSSSTTLSNSSRNQTCDLVSPSSSVYTPTPPQIFEIGKCPIKMYLKHHEGQIEDILNYLDELYLHHIEKMEEGRIDRMIIRRNSDELKTELKKIRTQIIKLQKKQLGQKDKIAFAHYRISNLEQIIKEIQARHQTNQEDL